MEAEIKCKSLAKELEKLKIDFTGKAKAEKELKDSEKKLKEEVESLNKQLNEERDLAVVEISQ